MPEAPPEPLTLPEADAAEAAFRAHGTPKADAAAVRFWQARLGVAADGVPGKQTWAALETLAPDDSGVAGSFPLAYVPTESYREGIRRFGARRSAGARAHAGVDLYAPAGTNVYAVADGVVRRVADFYAGTQAVEVDHGTFLARYCEVTNVQVKPGDAVRREQHLCDVGRMNLPGLPNGGQMLHLEVYTKKAAGTLTQPARTSARTAAGVPFLRRRDLTDPTPLLDRWARELADGPRS